MFQQDNPSSPITLNTISAISSVMEDRIFQMIVEENEVTWQTIIYDLVREEKMDPWNIDVSKLARRYIDMIHKLKEFDFKVSGKVLLAAALLLKIKSKRLVGEDMDEFDRLLAGAEINEADFYDSLEGEYRDVNQIPEADMLKLIPRTPQPRQRKVSVYDLVGALEKALEVKKRRIMRSIPEMRVEVPQKTTDITIIIKQVYKSILNFFKLNKGKKLTFSTLIPSESKQDKIRTFIPLLHLANQRKVDLEQEISFGEIEVMLLKRKEEQHKAEVKA
jgi:segregation and condensation protein A